MKPELLAPAGDLERAKTAIRFGADAVYLGGKRFSLRSRASNFELSDIKEAVLFASSYGAKIYVTVNMIPHDEDLEGLEEYLLELEKIGVSAVIVASVHIALLSKRIAPLMEVHLSTQQSVFNSQALEFYRQLGVDRVVLAREVNLDAIQSISSQSKVDLEVFIHGGMCVNVSGRCTLSNQWTLRDANRGGCAQSCRWKYRLYKNDTLISDPEIPFSMSSKDLIAVREVPKLIEAKIASLKIEGRMKSAYYIAIVVDAYRKLIDAIDQDEDVEKAITQAEERLRKAENRATASGFFHHVPNAKDHIYQPDGALIPQDFVAVIHQVKDNGEVALLIRNKLEVGSTLEIISPKHPERSFVLTRLHNGENDIEVAKTPMEVLWTTVDFPVYEGDILRKKGSGL